MKINRLVIENFKSIERIELIDPNPFTVFVGPNGSGKSNIFEALEYVNMSSKNQSNEVDELFEGKDIFLNRNLSLYNKTFKFLCDFENFECIFKKLYDSDNASPVTLKEFDKLIHDYNTKTFAVESVRGKNFIVNSKNFYYSFDRDDYWEDRAEALEYLQFFEEYSRLFIGKNSIEKIKRNSSNRLSLSASNLEKVLMRILQNSILKAEIFEWLELFVSGFESVAIAENPFDGEATLLWFEKFFERPFTRNLISDGTYNILALLTAVYQSDEPQFLCIEEPENGLNPKVVREFVNLFRSACEERGHYIWLNTHSQTLASVLTPDEIILVDKVDGATQVKQIKGMNLHGLPMDEAWLSNALGGGLPW